jgi:2-polyprenyl-3-methyl-5-hydroxy-6-metoxy-1,4-benzoquinol methylase
METHTIGPSERRGMKSIVKSILRKILRAEGLDTSVLARRIRYFWFETQLKRSRFPDSTTAIYESDLFKEWWYYSVELLAGQTTKGIYADDVPFLPRTLLAKCDLAGADCLDLGSMEGLIPTLMCRQGARSVLATDATFHSYNKMAALKHYYGVNFDFQQIGLMYRLSEKLKRRGGFDFINLSGVLYHVFSPLHVLAGVRPLLRKNGLMIISTNIVNRSDYSMDFNDQGRLQTETNTYWYPSVSLFEYFIRFFRLEPIDCLYHPYAENDPIRYVNNLDAGYLSVVCRASDDVALASDEWAAKTARESWEYTELCDFRMLSSQKISSIGYKGRLDERYLNPDNRSIDLSRAVRLQEPVIRAHRPEDSHLLRLSDRY